MFLLDAFPQAACTVYHCSDNFPAMFAGDFRRRFAAREEELIRRADLVICSHETLVEKCRQFSDRVHYLEHAVDERFFRPEGETPCPADLAEIPSPRVAFMGSLDAGLDYDLLQQATAATPELSWVLIGPVKPEAEEQVRRLAAAENVWALGPRPWEQLPAYLWNMEVGVIPYRQSAFSSARCPLKLYEYLAAGMRVVVEGGEVEQSLGGAALTVTTGPRFSQAVAEAVREAVASPDRGGRSNNPVADYSWSRRAQELSALIAAALRPRSGITLTKE